VHSHKFTAAPQAASVSGPPIPLRTSETSGHRISSSADERIAEQTDILTLYFNQAGMN
jgi:hypothetical protein